MAKEDGGIIVLEDDHDDGEELKTGSWVARPWKLPSSSHTSSVTRVQLQPAPSTLTGPSETSHATSKAQPQAPPSTFKSRPLIQPSNSQCLRASQIRRPNMLYLPNNNVSKEKEEHRPVSKKQIRYLENLLRLYDREIRKLQEKELDLTQLDDEDSIYIQENRLKQKMMRIFKKLCELKGCSSRTGRVIEQRIPYSGTRYPEVNRHIQKFINKPDNFPDYGDILQVIEKANIRHNLGLSKRQMQSMAADAFQDVGTQLQERRHLDMVYNFGSHLTDEYKAGADPALMDPVLARRLRDNRRVALSKLDEVVKKYAVTQDDGEEELDRRRRRTAATVHIIQREESRNNT